MFGEARAVLTAFVITVSDRVAAGEAEDRSGPAVAEALRRHGFEISGTAVVSDDVAAITAAVRKAVAAASLVATTGGTGLGPRDRTPEATVAVGDFLVPGVAEAMRSAGSASTPMAMLSRGVAAAVGRSLVLNLPGSPAGAVESLDAVAAVLPHALEILAGGATHPRP
ncbi:MAG TPA: MogA/MoaB family molybdenum cofactor biosynthesis protein [Candidatus Solibacter sp.]|jgi:molybdopterin adenylyltransferase|nr:MogA/MoaB family molybdenum cofactor biosynthesis protein [Candidatus Solibacter sp.]